MGVKKARGEVLCTFAGMASLALGSGLCGCGGACGLCLGSGARRGRARPAFWGLPCWWSSSALCLWFRFRFWVVCGRLIGLVGLIIHIL